MTTAADGFGLRSKGIDAETGDEVDLLDLAPQLVEHASFVTAVGERVARFASVRHASYVRLRRLDRPSAERLQLVSDYTPGWRLSDLLAESTRQNIPVDITVVIALMRQLLPAVALYGRHNREAAIGTLAVERMIVTPQTRLVIAEHAFGPALEKLNLGRDRLWRELRIAMPASAGLPRANQRGDAHAIGVIALSLLLGRPLSEDEFPVQQALVESAKEYRDGEAAPLSSSFSNWLSRALQIDVRTAFQAPSEAQLAFESVLASDKSYVTSSAKFEEWVSTVGGPIESKRPPQSAPDPEVLRQQELARQQEAQREQQREQQRELERQKEAERDREQEAELARLRDLERQRAEELERLREQERQRALEVERLREQEREREQQRELEREQERQRAQEAERLREQERQRAQEAEREREQERQRAQEAERVREQEREREKAREKEREQAREKEREQERQREQQRQKERELDRERERARALEQAAAAIAQTAEESAPPPAVEEDPIAAQIASYKRPVREVEEAPPQVYEPPASEAPAPVYDAPAQETPAYEAPAHEAAAYEEPAPEPAYAQQAQKAEPAPSVYTISEDTEKKSKLPLLAVAAVVILLLGGVGWYATRGSNGGGMRAGEGELAVQSRPQGARVVVDGKESGVTPTTIRLPAGPHVLEVQVGKSEPRVIPLTITAGVQTSQYIELRDVSATGGLEIRSNPSGARITIDGQPRGTTPATIPNLTPGDHTVVLELGGRKVSQAVKIAPGSTQKLVVPIPRK